MVCVGLPSRKLVIVRVGRHFDGLRLSMWAYGVKGIVAKEYYRQEPVE